MTDLLETTEDELDEQPCGSEERHGSHTFDTVGQNYTGEHRCPGKGLVTVSWSELDSFRQCPKKHDLGYLQRWQKAVEDNTSLGKGSLWHLVLEVHYNTIKAHQTKNDSGQTIWDCTSDELMQHCLDAVGKFIAKLEAEERDPNVIIMLQWMYAGHLEMWGLDEQWDILAVENTAVVPLYEADGSESWVRLKVKLDLLVRDSKGRAWIVDHKSCGTLPGEKDFDWADQFGLYVYALGQVGVRITGSIHSAARTKMNQGDVLKPGDPGYKSTMKAQTLDQRFARRMIGYTPAQLQCIADDALADFKLAHSEHNHKRRNPDEERCKWRCGFAEACMFGRRTGSDANMIDMLQRTGFAQEFARH
jgi:hypothetical protein